MSSSPKSLRAMYSKRAKGQGASLVMQGAVDQTLADLRVVIGAKADTDLARKLGVDQSTIASWRSRRRVPDRFVKMFDASAARVVAEPPLLSGDMQTAAHRIALIRYTLLRQEVAFSGKVDKALAAFLDLRIWWLMMHRAHHEMLLKMDVPGVDARMAQALIMQEDLRDPRATIARAEAQVADDLEDNPDMPPET